MRSDKNTWINFSYNGVYTKLIIGKNSKFEIEHEKRNFEGMTAYVKIEELKKVKITFFELNAELVNYLKASESSLSGVMFWDEENAARGLYNARYYQDETKQEVILTLYQKNISEVAEMAGVVYSPGSSEKFVFGKGNFKIGSLEVILKRANFEKSSDEQIERFKFNNSYRYFFNSKVSFKIIVNCLVNSLEDEYLINYLATVNNSMVEFTPHIDKPSIKYKNLYLECTITHERTNKKAEITLRQLPEINET